MTSQLSPGQEHMSAEASFFFTYEMKEAEDHVQVSFLFADASIFETFNGY